MVIVGGKDGSSRYIHAYLLHPNGEGWRVRVCVCERERERERERDKMERNGKLILDTEAREAMYLPTSFLPLGTPSSMV